MHCCMYALLRSMYVLVKYVHTLLRVYVNILSFIKSVCILLVLYLYICLVATSSTVPLGVDEDIFIKQFDQVPKVNVSCSVLNSFLLMSIIYFLPCSYSFKWAIESIKERLLVPRTFRQIVSFYLKYRTGYCSSCELHW